MATSEVPLEKKVDVEYMQVNIFRNTAIMMKKVAIYELTRLVGNVLIR